MMLSRIGFGFLGNILPAGINALVAGVGWFAVNSVSGAFALNALLSWNPKICLLIIVVVQIAVAFFGHNLVHAFERYAFPVLVIIFLIASVVIVGKAHPSAVHETGGLGGWLVTFGAAFGYAAGWNPYASDYTRYLPKDSNRRAAGLWAGLGVFISCVLLEVVGAAAATVTSIDKYADNPTAGFISHLPTGIGDAHPAGDRARRHLRERAQRVLRLDVVPGARHQAAADAAPGHRRARLRRRRLLPGAVRPARRGHQVQQLPAGHRVLDRPVARRLLRRPVAAPRQAGGRPALRPQAQPVGRGASRWRSPMVMSIWLVRQPDRS